MANTPIPDDILDDVYNSNASGGGVYLDRYGKYKLLIEQSLYKQIKDVGRCFITKIQVLAAEKIVVQEGVTRDRPTPATVEEDPHPVGYRCSYTINWDGKAKLSADGNAKALVLAVFGLNETKVSPDEFKSTFREIVSDKQPACGLVIQAEVRPKAVDKQEGVPGYYMRMPHWQCLGVPGQGENAWDKVKERRGEIEKYLAVENARVAEREANGAMQDGVPSIPGLPPASTDPLMGWTKNPGNAPGEPDPWYYKGSEQKRESQIRAGR